MKANSSLPTAEQVMQRGAFTLKPDQDVGDAVQTLLQHGISGAPVVDHGKVVGMFSEYDGLAVLAAVAYEQDPCGTVSSHMRTGVRCVGPDTDLFALTNLFLETRLRWLPVVDGDGRLLGVVTRAGVMRGLQQCSVRPAPHREPKSIFERATDKLAEY